MSPKLFCISTNWPELNATAAGVRIHELLIFFTSQGYSVDFCATSRGEEGRAALHQKGINTHPIAVNDAAFDEWLLNAAPDIVLFDRFVAYEQFGWRVRTLLPNALSILDTEDLHCLRAFRADSLKQETTTSDTSWTGNTLDLLALNEAALTKRELACIYQCDLTLVVSSFEKSLLINHFKVPADQIFLLPITYSKEHLLKERNSPDFNGREGYFFIGNGFHKPNVDAIKQLYTRIWPAIKKLDPKGQLYIYGAYLPQQVNQWHKPAIGFHIMGQVENVKTPYTKHRVNLAPLRFGAGIKGKLLESFVYGCPSVTTAIGKEGMDYQSEWPGDIGNSIEEFSEKAAKLYHNEKKWLSIRNQGFLHIDQYFERSQYEAAIKNTIVDLLKNLKNHRASNFIGALLQQQGFQASKYLSLWITEKNKNT